MYSNKNHYYGFWNINSVITHWIKTIFFHTVRGNVNRLMTDDTCVSEQLDCTNNGTPTSKFRRILPLDSDSESNKAKSRSCAVHRNYFFWQIVHNIEHNMLSFYSPSLRFMFYQLVSFKIKGEFNIFIGFFLHILFVCLVLLLLLIFLWVSFLGEEGS